MVGIETFDIYLPPRRLPGHYEYACAIVGLSPTSAEVVCDRIGWERGESEITPPYDRDGMVKMLRVLGLWVRYHDMPPSNMPTMRHLFVRAWADGYTIWKPEEWGDSHLGLAQGDLRVTPDGVYWEGIVHDRNAPGRPDLGPVQTELLPLEVLQRIASRELMPDSVRKWAERCSDSF